MGKIGTIIFLVIVVWQVVNSILEQSSKKKQGQQAKDPQLPRQTAARRQSPPGAGGAATARTPATLQTKDISRAETLAERRKEQLEELRRRRQGRAATPARIGTPPARSQTQVRTGPTGPTTRAPTAFPAPAAPVDIDSWRAGQEVDRLHEVALKQQHLQQQRATEQAHLARAERRTKSPRHRLADTHDLYDTPVIRHDVAADLRQQLRGTHSIRKLFLLKEMIDPPLALRSDPARW